MELLGNDLAGEESADPTRRLSLSHPGSRCPHCGHAITAFENIPILSYLRLRGRCSACHSPISLRYPLVEAATAVLSVAVVWRFGLDWGTAAALGLTWVLIALSLIDLDHHLLPDAIIFPVLWLGLLVSLSGIYTDPSSAIIGAAAGYLVLWTVYQIFKRTTGKEGMGYGDFKMLALFGAWFGWQYLPQIVLVSSMTGAVVGLAMILSGGRGRSQPIPFGPFLAVAGWVALMWGREINSAYMNWLGTPL